MTKREVLNAMANVVAINTNVDFMEFINAELKRLDSKKPSKKDTEKKELNDLIKDTIIAVLTANAETPLSITDMQRVSADLSGYSNQKLSALVKQLVDSGEVEKTIEKRKSYFSIPVAETADTETEEE